MISVPRVVEAALRGFACAYDGYEEEPFRLGELVAVREGPVVVFGVVAEVASGPDDPTRPLQPRGAPGQSAAEVMTDNPEIRLLLRTRVSVATCGYVDREMVRPQLPPLPPPLLARVEQATADETKRVAEGGAFLAALLASPACDDAVLGAALACASASFGEERRAFAVEAGKELARLLKAEPARLTNILRGLAR